MNSWTKWYEIYLYFDVIFSHIADSFLHTDDDNDDKKTNIKPDDSCRIDKVNENNNQAVSSNHNDDCKKYIEDDTTISPTVPQSPSSANPKDAAETDETNQLSTTEKRPNRIRITKNININRYRHRLL